MPTIDVWSQVPKEGERASLSYLSHEFGQSVTSFVGPWLLLFSVCSFWRVWCAAWSREKRQLLLGLTIGIVVIILIAVLARSAYLATDCWESPKGISDLFLALALACAFVGLFAFSFALVSGSAEAEMTALLQHVAEHETSPSRAVFAVHVSEARFRRFLIADVTRDAAITWETKGRCVPFAGRLFIVVASAISWYIVFRLPLSSSHRPQLWLRGMLVTSASLMTLGLCCRVLFTGAYQRCRKRCALGRQLADVRGSVRLVLFHNPADPIASKAEPSRLDLMSAAFFNGRLVAAFPPHQSSTPGWNRRTATSISDDEADPGYSIVKFTVTSIRQGTGLIDSEQRIGATMCVPLDRGQAEPLREWLQARHEAFSFGTFEGEFEHC